MALVADNYRARGYAPAEAELRFTPYHALPDTRVLVVKERDQVVATFSLVADNVLLGLPLETAYADEVAELRRQGRRLFETTCLAERGLDTAEFIQVFLALIRLAWQYGHLHGWDANVIAVHPRHGRFYSRLLGYAPLGRRRSYQAVAGHPAEAFVLDAKQMRCRAPLMHERIFGTWLPPGVLSSSPLAAALVRHLAARSTQTDAARVEEILRHVRSAGRPRRW